MKELQEIDVVHHVNAEPLSVFLIRTAFWCHLQPCMESCANHPSLKNRTFRSTALPPGRLNIPKAGGHVTSNLAWYALQPNHAKVPPR